MDANDYQKQSSVTLSNRLHGDKVTVAELRSRIHQAIEAGNRLDQVKKALFYGKGADLGATMSVGARYATEAVSDLAAGLGDDLIMSDRLKAAEVLIHMALGMFTEATEFLEAIFKGINGEPVDRINLLEEIGDIAWYQANALTTLESDFPTEFRRNNSKLRARFPEGFTAYDATHRDLAAERAILEGGGPIEADGSGTVSLKAPERFAVRCPICGLTNEQHRYGCPRHQG